MDLYPFPDPYPALLTDRIQSKLPVDIKIGKLLIYSCILRCVDPILSICASLSLQTPFLSPFDARQQAKEAHKKFVTSKSDHIAISNAFNAFKQSNSQKKFCGENFLSYNTMKMIEKLRIQFSEMLYDGGFIPFPPRGNQSIGGSLVNQSSSSMRILQACLAAGLYPNIIKIQPPKKTYTKIAEGGFYSPFPFPFPFPSPSFSISSSSSFPSCLFLFSPASPFFHLYFPSFPFPFPLPSSLPLSLFPLLFPLLA